MTSVGVIANQRSRGPGAHVTTARSASCIVVGPPGTSTSSACPWTQTLQPVFAFSSNPSTSNTTGCPATRREQRLARCAVDDPARGVRGVVHREHVRRPVDDESHPPDAPRRELRGAVRLRQDLEAGQSVHHRYPLRSSGRLGATRRRPVIARGTTRTQWGFWPPAHDSTARCSTSVARRAVRRALHQDTPARVMDRIDEVDLEARRRPVQLLELLAGIGTEDDGLAVDDVVDGNHEHGAGRQGDRDSADRERSEKDQALVACQLDESDVWVGGHGPTPGSSRFERRRPSTRSSDNATSGPLAAAQPRGGPSSNAAMLSAPVTCEARPTTMTLQPSCVTASMWSAWNPITVLSAIAAGWSWGSAQKRIRSPATQYLTGRTDGQRPGRCRDAAHRARSQMVQTLVSRQHVALGSRARCVSCLTSRIGPDHDDRAWRVVHDLVTDGAEDELAGPAEASRPDDHQRGVLRCVDEGRRGASCSGLTLDRMSEAVHVGVAHCVMEDLVGGLRRRRQRPPSHPGTP